MVVIQVLHSLIVGKKRERERKREGERKREITRESQVKGGGRERDNERW